MAITFVAVGAQTAVSTDGNTVAIPGGATTDDLMIMCVSIGGSPDPTFTLPAGWTSHIHHYNSAASSETAEEVFYKFHTGSESDPTISADASNETRGISAEILVFRGVDLSTPFDVTPIASNGGLVSTFTPTGVTTVTAGAWVVSFVHTLDDNALGLLSGSEQGFTPRASGASYDTAVGTPDSAHGVATKEITSPGAVTCPTWEETVNASDRWGCITFALRVSGASPSTTGAISSTLGKLSAAFTASQNQTNTIAATLPKLAAALNASERQPSTISATLHPLTAVFIGIPIADPWKSVTLPGTYLPDDEFATEPVFAAAIRDDGHVIIAAWTETDSATADLRAFDAAALDDITALTNVLTDSPESGWVDVFVDHTGGIDVAYMRGTAFFGTNRARYKRSIDGGVTWLDERELDSLGDTLGAGVWGGQTNPANKYQPAFTRNGPLELYVNPESSGLVLGGGSDGVLTSHIPDEPPEGICDFSGTNGPVVMRPRFKWRDSFFNDLGEVGAVCGVTFEPAVIDGHVTFDPARTITRDITLTFNLANLPEEMRGPAAPQKLAKRWISAEILVTVAGEDFGFPFGIFQLSADVGESMRENGQDRLTCKGYDPAILLTATTEQSYTVDSGTAYTDAVVTILDALGITLRAVYASVRVLPVDATWPVGTQWIAIINDLLTGLNYWPIWFDGDGKAWVWYRGNPEQESFGVNVVYSAVGDYRMIMAPFERSLTGADQPNQIVASVDDPARAPLSVTVRNETLPPNGIEVIGRTISADRRFDRVADADVLAGLAEWELVASRAKAHSATLLTFPDPRRNPRGRLREIYQLQLGDRLDADPSVGEPARTYWMCSGWEMDLTHPGVVMTHKIESILPLGALEVEFAFTSDGGLVIGGTGGPGDGSIPPFESDGGLVIGGSASVIVAIV